MAKCPLCTTRKGKRKCRRHDAFICSPCCGATRTAQDCQGCSFYDESALTGRDYGKLPHHAANTIYKDDKIRGRAEVIDSAIYNFDLRADAPLSDKLFLRIIEHLIDKYHFGDNEILFGDELEREGFNYINDAIESDMKVSSPDEITKVLVALYRSIGKQTHGRREYIEFISQFFANE